MIEGREGVHRGTPPRGWGWSHYRRGGRMSEGREGVHRGTPPRVRGWGWSYYRRGGRE